MLHYLWEGPYCWQVVLPYDCGDANGDGSINILDATFMIKFLYKSGPAPQPIGAADANSNGSNNLLDITYLISYLYRGGPAPSC